MSVSPLNQDEAASPTELQGTFQSLAGDESVGLLTTDRMMYGAVLCSLAYALFWLSGLQQAIG